MSEKPAGFVSLKSLKQKAPTDPQQVLAEIRKIYFATTARTIQNDLAHAIELLKTLPTEDEREKARVYMDGLSQMRTEWDGKARRKKEGGRRKKEPR